MKKLLVILTMLMLSVGAYAKTGKIEAGVDLFPMGDFIAKAKIKGKAKKSGGGYTASKLTVKVKKFKTGLDVRDEHTLKYMKAKKYPTITLTKGKAKGGKGTAVLEFMGKKKKIRFKYKVEDGMLVAKFDISWKAFGGKKVDYKGIGVKDTVEIKAYVPIK